MSNKLPEGRYKAVCVCHEFGTSELKGSEFVSCTFKILPDDNYPEGTYPVGEQIEWRGYLTEKAIKYVFDPLERMGWVGGDITNLGKLDTPVQIVVRHEEYNGYVNARVAFINSLGVGAGKVLSDQMVSIKDRAAAAYEQYKKDKLEKQTAQRELLENTQPFLADEDLPF